MFDQKRILITGGTGSFGKKFTERILQLYPRIREVVIFSRDREKQQRMACQFEGAPLSFVCGDISKAEDLAPACRNIDFLIHTAALRIVPEAEASPWEAVQTNILGARNVIDQAVKYNIGRILSLSTDMASLPHNVYGATKMLADKLFVNAPKDHPSLKTTVVRYGNILGSTGTVIPFFMRKAREEGILPVTDPGMTRFLSTREECVEIALHLLAESKGGEIVSPKIKSYNILTAAKAVDEKAEIRIVGLRPGEKLYEEMITRYESYRTIENDNYYIIVPDYADITEYCRHYSARTVPAGFEFNSANNPDKISLQEMRELIRKFS